MQDLIARLLVFSNGISPASKSAWRALAARSSMVPSQDVCREAAFLDDVAALDSWLATHPATAPGFDVLGDTHIPAVALKAALGHPADTIFSLRDPRTSARLKAIALRLPQTERMNLRNQIQQVKAAGIGALPGVERALLQTLLTEPLMSERRGAA